MDYSALDFWWKVAITILNFGIGVYLWYERRQDRSNDRYTAIATAIRKLREDLDARLDDTRTRLTRLESDVHPRLSAVEKIAHPESCKDLEACCMDITQRVAAVEQKTKDGPNHDDLARLHRRVDDVAGLLKKIEGESAAQTRILHLVYESLISRPK